MILEDLEDLIRPISAEAAEIIRRKSARLERRYKEIANGVIVDDGVWAEVLALAGQGS